MLDKPIITVDDLFTYENNTTYDDGTQEDSPRDLQNRQMMVDSACDLVIEYLGYNPSIGVMTEVIDDNYDSITLSKMPYICGLESCGVLIDSSGSIAKGRFRRGDSLSYLQGYLPVDETLDELKEDIGEYFMNNPSTHSVVMGQEYSTDLYMTERTIKKMPAQIKLTALRLASLLKQESGGNIGFSSANMNNEFGSYSFVNYTNLNKYLRTLQPYKRWSL